MAGYTSKSPGDDFVEASASTSVMPVADAVVFFPNLIGWSSGGQDSSGWIDVRGLDNVVVLGTATTEDATFTIDSRRTSADPIVGALAAPAAVTAGNTTALYDSTIARISHIRILQKYTSTPGGTSVVSFLAE